MISLLRGPWAYLLFLCLSCPLGACKKSEARAVPAAESKTHVQSQIVDEKSAPVVLTLTGVLDAQERTDLAANSIGRVVRTFVERGQRVNAGDVIAQLDTRVATLTQTELEANAKSVAESLASARADCDRYEALLKKGAITQQEYDRAIGQCKTQAASQEAAQARAASAGQTIRDASIRAPFAGVIAERFSHVGDYVRADTKVATLLVDDPLRLRLSVPEPSISFAKEGVRVTFETAAAPNRSFSGAIKFVGREVRATTRDLVVEASVDNQEHVLLPGMFVTAELPVGEVTLPVVPATALVHRNDNDSVFAVGDGRLEERIVELGPKVGDLVAVADGVKTGERIVVSPPPGAVDGVQAD